jgi:gp53 family protein
MTPRSQTLTIDVPPSEWVTANGRYHWAEKAKRVRALRFRARMLARRADLRHADGPVRVIAHVHTRTRGRLDPDNAAPTTKALLDGLTRDPRDRWAGVWDDDDHTRVIGPDHRRGPTIPTLPRGFHRITLTIVETHKPDNQ